MGANVMDQLSKAAKAFFDIDWNLYNLHLTRYRLALAKKNQDKALEKRLEKRLERLLKERARSIWLKKEG